MAIQNYKNNNIIINIKSKYENILSLLSHKNDNLTLQKFTFINHQLEKISNDMEEFETELELNYTKKKDSVFINKILELEKYKKNIKLLYPYMLMLNLIPQEETITCKECQKKFTGNDYLRRYRQHYHAKHFKK